MTEPGDKEEASKLRAEAARIAKQLLEPRDALDEGAAVGPGEEAVVQGEAGETWRFRVACQAHGEPPAQEAACAVRRAGLLWRQGCCLAERGAKGTQSRAVLCLIEAVLLEQVRRHCDVLFADG